MSAYSGVNAGHLPALEEVLWEWVATQERGARILGSEDAPWWYNERASLSTLAGAVWRAGGIVLEEHSTEKKAKSKSPAPQAYVWGGRYLLKVIIENSPPEIQLTHRAMVMRVRPGSKNAKRKSVIEDWYRELLKREIPPLLAKWGRLMKVEEPRFGVRKMKTKWGSCIPPSNSIILNLELAKKPRECLEYIVVHELAHLIEPTHNDRFVGLMDRYMPKWQFYRDELNRLPVRHERWGY